MNDNRWTVYWGTTKLLGTPIVCNCFLWKSVILTHINFEKANSEEQHVMDRLSVRHMWLQMGRSFTWWLSNPISWTVHPVFSTNSSLSLSLKLSLLPCHYACKSRLCIQFNSSHHGSLHHSFCHSQCFLHSCNFYMGNVQTSSFHCCGNLHYCSCDSIIYWNHNLFQISSIFWSSSFL